MIVAVIPARGGSKRVPRKNIRVFCGKPIIAWSIEAARAAGCFDRVVVSTDDSAIAAIARAHGAETPFERPAELAGDHVSTAAVMRHVVDEAKALWSEPTALCCLYATAPFVRPADLRAGFDRLSRGDCRYVFAVAPYLHPIERALRRSPDGRIEMITPEWFCSRTQDFETSWHDAGQFYWARAETWLDGMPVFTPNSIGLPLPRGRAFDIDTEEDWRSAELAFDPTRAA